MRILVVSNLYPPDVMGGYELCCRQMVDALADRGHNVRVLTSAPRMPVPAEPHVCRRLRLTDVWSHYQFHHSAPITSHLSQSESHRINSYNVHALLNELEIFRPDVVYLHMLVGIGGLGLLACLEHLRVPWVWQLGDNVPVSLCEAGGRALIPLIREYNRQIRGHYVVVSRQLADAIESAGIALQGDVDVVPNWVVGPPSRARERYYRGDHLRIVAAASVIDRKIDKGIDLGIEAIGILRERGYDDLSFDVYGHVADPYFPSLVMKRGITDLVTFHGNASQDDLGEALARSDVFLFPTRPGEPFGVAPLEAAACGCVPLISHTCGIAEWLVHGVHCLKASRRAHTFADSLAAILDGRIELEPISRRAAAMVHRDFHINIISARIEQHLARASQQSRRGAGTPEDAYRLALLAEKLTGVLLHDSLCA